MPILHRYFGQVRHWTATQGPGYTTQLEVSVKRDRLIILAAKRSVDGTLIAESEESIA